MPRSPAITAAKARLAAAAREAEERVLPAVTVLPYEIATARVFGRIHAWLSSRGQILPDADVQMAQRVGDLRYRFQWDAPIRISPNDPAVLYHASNHVHR